MPGEYIITFSDVMAGVITLAIGALGFLVKSWLKQFQTSMEKLEGRIKESEKIMYTRIENLEQETDAEIADIKKQIGDIKGDFATTFVLREDFFRATNGLEDRVKSIDSKMDRLLMQSNR